MDPLHPEAFRWPTLRIGDVAEQGPHERIGVQPLLPEICFPEFHPVSHRPPDQCACKLLLDTDDTAAQVSGNSVSTTSPISTGCSETAPVLYGVPQAYQKRMIFDWYQPNRLAVPPLKVALWMEGYNRRNILTKLIHFRACLESTIAPKIGI